MRVSQTPYGSLDGARCLCVSKWSQPFWLVSWTCPWSWLTVKIWVLNLEWNPIPHLLSAAVSSLHTPVPLEPAININSCCTAWARIKFQAHTCKDTW